MHKIQIRNIVREIVSNTVDNILKENHGEKIICYHRSNELEHMIKGNFNLELSDDVALFGNAIYFSESPNIAQQFGKYICKFEITLDKPVLDLNAIVDGKMQQKIVDKFNSLSNNNFETDIDDKLYPNVQFGDVLMEISDEYDWDFNKYYKQLIQSFGYNSFKYFCNYHTDFINERGDYGLCYGLYNSKNIKYIDGPF